MSQENVSPTRQRIRLLVVSTLVTAVCLFGQLGAIGLVGPDEPRYVWIARAMAGTADWITPRLYGQPWFEKPILYYWTAALGFRLHLPDEWAARLPSAFAALFAALAIAWLGWRFYRRDARFGLSPATLAPLIWATSVAAIGFARAATPDMLFSAAITLAMASAAAIFSRSCALRSSRQTDSTARRESVLPLVLFGAFLGLGVLAKGPAGVALAAGAIALWALVTQKWRAAMRVVHPLAIGAFSVVAMPWYVLCALRNPDFLSTFLWQHNVERYLTPMFEHRQPFWFFGGIILLALLPWTALLVPLAQRGLKRGSEQRWSDSPGFFFACWAIFPIVFFSFSQSKLPGYVLPAVPALALLCAVAFLRTFESSRSAAVRIALSLAASCVGIAVAALYAAQRVDWTAAHADNGARLIRGIGYAVLVITIFVAIGLVAAGFRRNPSLAVGLCALWVGLSVEAVNLGALPLLDYFHSARPHAGFMRNDRKPDRIFTYQLRRQWQFGLAYYFRRELPEWSPSDPQPALVLTTPEGAKAIRKLGRIGGSLDEHYAGILYVPVTAAPASRQ